MTKGARTTLTRALAASELGAMTTASVRQLLAGVIAAGDHEAARRWLLWCVEKGFDLDAATAGLSLVG